MVSGQLLWSSFHSYPLANLGAVVWNCCSHSCVTMVLLKLCENLHFSLHDRSLSCLSWEQFCQFKCDCGINRVKWFKNKSFNFYNLLLSCSHAQISSVSQSFLCRHVGSEWPFFPLHVIEFYKKAYFETTVAFWGTNEWLLVSYEGIIIPPYLLI